MERPALPKLGIHFAHSLLRARDWQHRPELDQLCRWWAEGGAGVCALVGIGGAGKTAIAERFLRVLPNVLPKAPDIPKNDELPTPEGLFVFSFYDVPNPDSFFAQLAAWLTGSPVDESARPPSYQQTLLFLQRVGSCLLVLDGLEKVQDDGARGGIFGQILDRRLSDLVLQLASGYLPGVSTIITTRFPIAELEEELPPHYFPVGVEEISETAGIGLLRQRGVKGPDVELRRIVRECGNHALTVDLVGGYIADLGGDTKLEFGTSDELKAALQKEPNPRRRRVLQQEYKFARIAERYHEAFARKDPAALALLERVCLFRLGAGARMLASIFTGKGKGEISGLPLARLNKKKLQDKLDLLVRMRLLEASEQKADKPESPVKYTAHPAVRDGFLRGLDAETARRGHDAAREGLTESLGGLPGVNTYPSDPATLDTLEEIVYHTLAAGLVQEAFDIYWDRIGRCRNLLWRLGAYERGERICRAFASGQSPKTAPLPKGLSENDQPIFINEWALYLINLGRLDAAARCHERNIEMHVQQQKWENASIGNRNLAEVMLLAGRLAAGLRAAEEALSLAELAETPRERSYSHAKRANGRALRGETDPALNDFRNALQWQHKFEGKTNRPLYSLRGIWHAQFLASLGEDKKATRLTEVNKRILVEEAGPRNFQEPLCNLLLADLARRRGDLTSARDLLEQAHDWGIARDAKEPLCWSALVQARIALDANRQDTEGSEQERDRLLEEARANLQEGLRIARDCGYGIYHIDLLLLQAQVALYQGNTENAARDVLIALNEGVHPKPESGMPTLLAATDPECGYAWGEAEARHLLAEAHLLEAAQKLGQTDFAPARFDSLPDDVKELINDSREQLTQCRDLRKRIQDPKIADTKNIIKELEGGVLTAYPLEWIATTPAPQAEPVAERKKPMAKKHVFLSYCHENTDDVAKLRDDLIAAGESVWWDKDILPGQDWKLEIRKAMKDSYAVVLCLSEETEARITSGVYPEISDAIDAYRQYKPGSIFLIPVRLSKCEIPPFGIDAKTTLDGLEYVNLFPPSKRGKGLQRLIQALKATPYHP